MVSITEGRSTDPATDQPVPDTPPEEGAEPRRGLWLRRRKDPQRVAEVASAPAAPTPGVRGLAE